LLEAAGAGAYADDIQQQQRETVSAHLAAKRFERNYHSDTEPLKTAHSPSTGTSGVAMVSGDERGYTTDDPQIHHGSISSISTISEGADSAISLAKDSTEWIHLDHRDGLLLCVR
uniref:Pecanex-like protein n=1 Tax=Anisakis simplex TaxID=6269 RepID=A0A0M3J9V1_ANISI